MSISKCEKGWIRKCPICEECVYHKREQNCKSYDKQQLRCKKCRAKNMMGKGNPFFGKHHLKNTKNILKEKWKNKYKNGYRNPNKGKPMSESQKLKISKANSGLNNAFYKKGFFTGRHHKKSSIEKIKKASIGKKFSEETKRKLREARLKLGNTNFNKNACIYFDHLNEEKGWNLRHALNGGETKIIGYSLDAYDKQRNIVVEYDEPRHYTYRQKLKPNDVERMKRIIKYLGCVFFRYNEKTKKLKQYG